MSAAPPSPTHAPIPADIRRLIPILSWLPHYDRSNLRVDIVAGIAIWALVIPQHIAYAQIAGLPPQAGIFVSIWAPLVYAIFGTSRQLMCGPSSSTAIISAAHVGSLAHGDVQRFATLSAALAVLAGIIFLVLGAFKLGFVSAFISSAVQIGFLFGLGLTIAVGQAFELLDIPSVEGAFVTQFLHLVRHLDEASWWSLGIGVAAFTIVWIIERRWPRVPSALVVVVAGILAVTIFNLQNHRVATIGDIQGRLPDFEIPMVSLSTWGQLLPAAVAIVLVCYSESTTIARRYADKHRYEVRPDQELVALGASSLVCGLFQGFCSSGGASQSAANDRNGARTQVTSLVLAGLAALTAVALMPLLSNLPFAVLAAVVINAVLGFFNISGARRVLQLRPWNFVAGLFAFVGVVLWGILPGLVIGIVASLGILLANTHRPRLGQLVSRGRPLAHPVTVVTGDVPAGLLVLQPVAPVIYLNATAVHDAVKQALRAASPPPQVVVLDLSASADLDITALDMLQTLATELDTSDTELWLANLQPGVLDELQHDPTMAAKIVASIPAAVATFTQSAATPAEPLPSPTPGAHP